MVWGPIAKVGDLPQVKTDYHCILQHHSIPSGTQFMSKEFVLMQDNDLKHTSKLCSRCI